MKKLLSIFLIAICTNAYSQVEAYLESGDTIIVNENNTWEQKRKTQVINSDIDLIVEASVKVDDFSDVKTASTKTWLRWSSRDGKGGMLSSSSFNGKARAVDLAGVQIIVFDITYVGDLGCLSRSSEMIVKLVNGELIKLYNVGDTDCGSDSQSGTFCPVELSELSDMSSIEEVQAMVDASITKLRDTNIEKIKLTGSKYYTEQIPNTKFKNGKAPEFFRQHIWALQKVL